MQKIIIIIFALLTNLLCSSSASAESYLLNRSYFEDKTNALSLADVKQQRFIPFEDVLTAGYRQGTIWIRLNIAASNQPLVLKIRPIFTEEIEPFDPLDPERRPRLGNKHPWSASDLDSLSYNFLLAPGTDSRDIYLQIKSVRSYLVHPEVMSLEQYQRLDRYDLLTSTAYTTITFLLAMWLLVTWLMHRELVLGLFTIQQFIAFIHTSLHSGLVRLFFDEHLDPLIANQLFSLLVVLYPLIGILTNKYLLHEYGLKKAYRIGFNLLLLMSLCIIGLYALSDMSLTFNLNSILVMLVILFFAIAATFGVDLSKSKSGAEALSIRTLRAYYLFNVALWCMTILPLQGLLSAGEIALHSLHIYNILSGLIFFFLMNHRSRSLLEIETRRSSAFKAEADQERRQREEQSMLMSMLTHEIKTPLSVLKLVVDEKVAGTDLEGHANRAVSNIDFIVNRCLQIDKVDTKSIHTNKSEVLIFPFLNGIVAEKQVKSRILIECPHDLAAQTDSEILRIILSNLVDNALKYSPAHSTIHIEVRHIDRRGQMGIQISTTNEIGLMGTPDPEFIFKKYYRNASATKIRGSGLGLYLVHQLTAVIGGKIEFQTQEKNIIFLLWIPT